MQYVNPILKGFNPDPSICRVKDDYYLVTSSFEYFPGIPVYHSTDLVNWKQIGNCIDRAGQLPFHTAKTSGGIWAPTIRWHRGTFYVTATFDSLGNFIVSSKDPAAGWSDPVFVPIGGIDPSLLFEDDRVYYCTNDNGNGSKDAISLVEIDVNTGRLLSDIRQIWHGTGGGFLEAPHLYHIGSWYYLLAAEGGTNFSHMITVARSRTIWGPYESYYDNPIFTNRNDTSKAIACTGHGDLVEDAQGNWWMVHLATRPANNWLSHLGRESFLAPVTWKEEWPVVGYDKKAHIQSDGPLWKEQQCPCEWNADLSRQEPNWLFLREPAMENYCFGEDGGLVMKPSTVQLSDASGSPTLLLVRPLDMQCVIRTEMTFAPSGEQEEAGLVLYLSNQFYYHIYKTREQDRNFVIVEKHALDFEQRIFCEPVEDGRVAFQIRAEKERYYFYYSVNGKALTLAGSATTKFLSVELAGKCFTGTLVGLYTQCGCDTDSQAVVHHFSMGPVK